MLIARDFNGRPPPGWNVGDALLIVLPGRQAQRDAKTCECDGQKKDQEAVNPAQKHEGQHGIEEAKGTNESYESCVHIYAGLTPELSRAAKRLRLE